MRLVACSRGSRTGRVVPALLLLLGCLWVTPAPQAQSDGDLLNSRISIKALIADDGWDRPLRSPSALFYDNSSDELLVADAGNSRVLIFDQQLTPRHSFIHYVPDRITGQAVKGQPRDLVVNSRGEIILIDNHADFLDILDFRGTSLDRVFLNRLIGDTSRTIKPEAIAIDEFDRLFIGTSGDVVGIFVLTPDFALERIIGTESKDVKPFQTIMALTVADSTLFVTDLYAEPAIKLFDLQGKYLGGFAGHDVDRADVSFPAGIATLRDPVFGLTIWVADGLRQVVKVYREDGTFLALVGGFGLKLGEFRYPSDIATDGSGVFFVLERVGARIQRFIID